MKHINEFIHEKLIINKDSKSKYTCHPKNWDELRNIIKERLKEDKNANLNDIDVSEITDIGYLFKTLDPHNIDISEWDVSNIENMDSTFYKCKNFNCNLSKWNVRKVESMYEMFYNCENFNCDLSKWDVRNVTDMEAMFNGCQNFEGEGVENWKISKNTNTSYMFTRCNSLKNYPDWY